MEAHRLLNTIVHHRDTIIVATTSMTNLRGIVTGAAGQAIARRQLQARDTTWAADARPMRAMPAAAAHQLTAALRHMRIPATRTSSELGNGRPRPTPAVATVGIVQVLRQLIARRVALVTTAKTRAMGLHHSCGKVTPHRLRMATATAILKRAGVIRDTSALLPPCLATELAATAAQDHRHTDTSMHAVLRLHPS